MASIEYLEKRIEGATKKADMLSRKLERIQKAKEAGWDQPPYYYSEYDLKYTLQDIEDNQKQLKKYEAQLLLEKEKAASRNIEPILRFLEAWKERIKAWHESAIPDYIKAKEFLREIETAFHDYRRDYFRTPAEERNKEEFSNEKKEYDTARTEFQSVWHQFEEYILPDRDPQAKYPYRINYELLDKDLSREAEIKYDDLVERTNAIVGQITDASGLEVGAKGELNGLIYGTRGTARVKTIGAGGYNIQCFHFRTLVNDATKKTKEKRTR